MNRYGLRITLPHAMTAQNVSRMWRRSRACQVMPVRVYCNSICASLSPPYSEACINSMKEHPYKSSASCPSARGRSDGSRRHSMTRSNRTIYAISNARERKKRTFFFSKAKRASKGADAESAIGGQENDLERAGIRQPSGIEWNRTG